MWLNLSDSHLRVLHNDDGDAFRLTIELLVTGARLTVSQLIKISSYLLNSNIHFFVHNIECQLAASPATLTEVFPCSFPVVRQMSGYNSEKQGTVRTLPD
jgi:hypothetical protein